MTPFNNSPAFEKLPKAIWQEVWPNYWVIKGECCYGTVKLIPPHHVANIVCSPPYTFKGDLGKFTSRQTAKRNVEDWLVEHRQVGIYTEIKGEVVRSYIVPIRPRTA